MVCPVCGKKSESLLCPDCGFDMSRDYEGYPTLNPLKEGLPSRAVFREDLKNLLRCSVCGGISFRVNALEDKLRCCNCGAETYYQGKRKEKNWSENILRSDEISMYFWDGKKEEIPVFGSIYRREQICSITFMKSLVAAPKNAWDVSEAGDGKVLAWVIPNGELYDLYIGAEGGICAGESCRYLFAGYINVHQFLNLNFLHTENVQSTRDMFFDCSSLTSLDLSSFDTSNVQDMRGMFHGCSSLTSLDLRSFDTSNVQDMSGMFYGCNSLTGLDLRSFDTSNVQDMSQMFMACNSLTDLDLSNFDTSNTEDMGGMFMWCSSLTGLDLSSFDTSNVQRMNYMFNGCSSLTSVDLRSFDTSNVQGMQFMFTRCSSLTSVDLRSFDTSNVKDTILMFGDCPAGADWQHLLK